MPMTRQQSADALQHIYTVVFGLQQTAPLIQGLNMLGIKNIHDLMTMDEASIGTLEYKHTTADGTVVRRRVPKGKCNLVTILKHYERHRNNNGNPINNAWTSITQQQFDDFRISEDCMIAIQNDDGSVNFADSNIQNLPLPVSQSVPPTTTPQSTVSWDKGVKRYSSPFPTQATHACDHAHQKKPLPESFETMFVDQRNLELSYTESHEKENKCTNAGAFFDDYNRHLMETNDLLDSLLSDYRDCPHYSSKDATDGEIIFDFSDASHQRNSRTEEVLEPLLMPKC